MCVMFPHRQVRTVGHVPAGLPPVTVSWWLSCPSGAAVTRSVFPIQLSHTQVRTVGPVPAGLPPLTVSWWLLPEEDAGSLALVAATLTVVGLMESMAIGKSLAAAHHHDIDPNQELVGEDAIL